MLCLVCISTNFEPSAKYESSIVLNEAKINALYDVMDIRLCIV